MSQRLQGRHWQTNEGGFQRCGKTLQEEDAQTWFKESGRDEKKGSGYIYQGCLKRGETGDGDIK